MDKNNKKNTKLKIATILSWVTCCILCLLFDRCNLSVPAVRWMTCAIFCSLILSIVLSVKLKKSKPKTRLDKNFVDENIKVGRKIYNKNIRRLVFKDMSFFLSIAIVILIPLIIYLISKKDTLALIILSSFVPFMFAVGVLSYRSVAKRFFFKYKELIFNDESFVLFASTSSIFGYVKPSFHVIYNGVEYSRSSRIIWTGVGALTPDDIIIPYLKDLIDWFSDQEFSKFLKIDIDTEKSGKIQCVYKLFAKDFIVTDQLDNLKGCFKYSQSTIKSKKAINDDDEDLDGNDIDIDENIDIDEDEN